METSSSIKAHTDMVTDKDKNKATADRMLYRIQMHANIRLDDTYRLHATSSPKFSLPSLIDTIYYYHQDPVTEERTRIWKVGWGDHMYIDYTGTKERDGRKFTYQEYWPLEDEEWVISAIQNVLSKWRPDLLLTSPFDSC